MKLNNNEGDKAEISIEHMEAPPLVRDMKSWDKMFQGVFLCAIIEEIRKEGDTIDGIYAFTRPYRIQSFGWLQ